MSGMINEVYNPDNWVVFFVNTDDPHYKILAGWSGGYTTGDSWRINSDIVRVEEKGDRYYFFGSSGSIYSCHKESYCLRMNNGHVWNELKRLHGDKVELLPENTDWINFDFIIKE